jgi:hypothetical protein
VTGRKAAPPPKVCAACARPFAWRKKWALNWDAVRFCSAACREGRYMAAKVAAEKWPKGA